MDFRAMAVPPSPADRRVRRLAALSELAGEVEFRLMDAQALAAEAERAHAQEALRISREDVVALTVQLEALDYVRALIEAEAEREAAA
jgi:hypothetical protein